MSWAPGAPLTSGAVAASEKTSEVPEPFFGQVPCSS